MRFLVLLGRDVENHSEQRRKPRVPDDCESPDCAGGTIGRGGGKGTIVRTIFLKETWQLT